VEEDLGACGAHGEGLAAPRRVNPTCRRFYLRVAARSVCYSSMLGGNVTIDTRSVERCGKRAIPPDMVVRGGTAAAHGQRGSTFKRRMWARQSVFG
jgi:hypothetical protein